MQEGAVIVGRLGLDAQLLGDGLSAGRGLAHDRLHAGLHALGYARPWIILLLLVFDLLPQAVIVLRKFPCVGRTVVLGQRFPPELAIDRTRGQHRHVRFERAVEMAAAHAGRRRRQTRVI